MGDAAPPRVDARPAERLRVDLLVGHRADDIGAGDEHVARPLDHDREVGHRGRVDRAARTRTEDDGQRSEEHTSELQSRQYLVCRLLLEKKKTNELQSLQYLVL